MRALATIIALAMSVTTGGPLRCPCRVAALFHTSAGQDPPRATARPAEKACCHCKTHQDEPERGPASPKPAPEPCGHGPGVDLLTPSGGERVAGECGGLPSGLPEPPAVAVPRLPDAPARTAEGRPSPPPDLLRYSHAFRC